MVSIINLCYNTGHRLKTTLDSIKNQTYKDFEIIILDDASSDSSVNILKQWMAENSEISIKLIQNQKNLGITSSLNKALTHSRGNYISVIGDDSWDSNFLEKLVPVIDESDERVALVYSACTLYNVDTKQNEYDLGPLLAAKNTGFIYSKELFEQTGENIYRFRKQWLREILLWSNIVVVFTTVIKKDVLQSIGGFNEKYCFEDYPLWLRLSKSYDFLYVNESLAKYNRYNTNFSMQKNYQMDLNILNMLVNSYDNNYTPETLSTLQNRILATIISLLKYSFKQKKGKTFLAVVKEGFRFLNWPSFTAYRFLFKKFNSRLFA